MSEEKKQDEGNKSVVVSNAGSSQVNGQYDQVDENVYEMSNSHGKYCIRIDNDKDITPPDDISWCIQKIDTTNPITFYMINLLKHENPFDNPSKWNSIVGNDPSPKCKLIKVCIYILINIFFLRNFYKKIYLEY